MNNRGVVEVAPLAFMRGRTLNDSFIILDEAQNTTGEQMKMFLTRLGFGARMVVTGDTSQVDLPRGTRSGLLEARRILSNTPGIGVVDLSAELASMIEGFVPLFPSITITGVPGNHPRYSKKMPAKQAYNNADWMMYKMLEHRLSRYKSIKCDFPMSAFSRVTIAERWKLLLFHGDGIRSSMPGVPWGGLSRRVASLMEQFGAAQVAVDYIACGHFHTANALDGVQVETFMNGSLKGVDEYSVKQFGGGRRAKQRLIFFHEKRGATSLAWIDLQDTIPSAERRAA